MLKASPLRITIILPCAGGAQVNSASLSFVSTLHSAMLRSIAIPLKLSEAEFSEYHQPNAASSLGLIRTFALAQNIANERRTLEILANRRNKGGGILNLSKGEV